MSSPQASTVTGNRRSRNLRRLVLTALFVALVALATMAIHIPMPGAMGYVNVGDAVIFVVAMLMGWKEAAVAGGLGSALADVLLGYTYWAPWTLVIKGVEGMIAAAVGYSAFRRPAGAGRVTLALVAGCAWMLVAYTAATAIIAGRAAAIGALPGNGIQALASVALALPILAAARAVSGRVRI